jgi:hypothetical protein
MFISNSVLGCQTLLVFNSYTALHLCSLVMPNTSLLASYNALNTYSGYSHSVLSCSSIYKPSKQSIKFSSSSSVKSLESNYELECILDRELMSLVLIELLVSIEFSSTSVILI